MEYLEQRESGLIIPRPSSDLPFFRFILNNMTTEWGMENFETVWNSPIYDDIESIRDVTMNGVDIQKANGFGDTAKGITVSMMMVRGLKLANMSCWAVATGSPLDVLACYRMLCDRALTLQYLDKTDQYEAWEKRYWAEAYFWLGEALSIPMWRKQATPQEVQSFKDRQVDIREKHFNGELPMKPKMVNDPYWTPPRPEVLARTFSFHPLGLPEPENSEVPKMMRRLYELGNKSVHPMMGDMMQTEDIGWSADSKEGMDMVLMALASLTTFGLSRHPATELLAREIVATVVSRREGD